MNKSHFNAGSAAAILAGAFCLACVPASATPITIISDNFSTTSVHESQSTLDTFTLGGAGGFTTQNGSNVDVLGNIGSVETSPDNLTDFEGICAASGSANCVDLDGTGGTPQGQLESAALSLTAGTYSFSYNLLGSSGFMTSGQPGYSFRQLPDPDTTSTTIIFGNATCIANYSTTPSDCVYDQTQVLGSTNNSAGPFSATGLAVSGSGPYFVEFISNTSGQIGSILTDVNLTETTVIDPTPEPSTMFLLGAGLLGLGGIRRWRTRRASR